MKPTFVVEHVQTQKHLEDALSVRRRVFIDEQSVPESIERDEFDQWRSDRDDVLHVVGYLGDRAVAAGRVVMRVASGGVPKIGRIAVLKELRGEGLGVEIMKHLHDLSESRGASSVKLSAQCQALSFYVSLGYEPVGDIYLEANIEHQMMEYRFGR
ncbi:MAG: GNAT family N-acetyltransferase [Deltaproteobacteria bacterium]|nr:GNAT family N-acetyltransferase [Deltaproteobacteria bacterium]